MAASDSSSSSPVTSSGSGQTAGTHDWNTAYGIPFKFANQAIVDAGSSPKSFSGPYTDPMSGNVYTTTGDFGAWQLCAGGCGADVNMSIPVKAFKLGITVLDALVVVQVHMNLLPQPSTPQTHELKVKDTTIHPKQEPVVTVQTVTVSDPKKQAFDTAISSVVGTWLTQNIQSFNHVFASVDIGQQAKAPGLQWLKPTKISYAVVAPSGSVSSDDNILGILAMVEGRDNPKLSNQLSPNIIPAGADSGFLIEQSLFVEKIFMPGVYTLFNQAAVTDFKTTNDGATITNTSTLQLGQLEFSKSKTVTDAQIAPGNFSITFLNQEIMISFVDLNFTWQPGYTVHMGYSGTAVLSLGPDNRLQMKETGTPSTTVTVTQSTASKWEGIGVQVLIGVGASVAGAMIGAMVGPAATAVADAAASGAADAGDAVAVVASDSASFTVDGIADAGEDTSTAAEDAESDADEQGSDRVTNADNPNGSFSFKGWFKSNWRILLGMAVGGSAGAGLNGLAKLLHDMAQKNLKSVSTFEVFADEATSSTQWQGSKSTTLVSAALNESLQMGFKIDS